MSSLEAYQLTAIAISLASMTSLWVAAVVMMVNYWRHK